VRKGLRGGSPLPAAPHELQGEPRGLCGRARVPWAQQGPAPSPLHQFTAGKTAGCEGGKNPRAAGVQKHPPSRPWPSQAICRAVSSSWEPIRRCPQELSPATCRHVSPMSWTDTRRLPTLAPQTTAASASSSLPTLSPPRRLPGARDLQVVGKQLPARPQTP